MKVKMLGGITSKKGWNEGIDLPFFREAKTNNEQRANLMSLWLSKAKKKPKRELRKERVAAAKKTEWQSMSRKEREEKLREYSHTKLLLKIDHDTKLIIEQICKDDVIKSMEEAGEKILSAFLW